MDQPLVSVILPTYNRKKLIKRCIRSILSQTYDNIELIVIDDGSTDNTLSAVKKFKDKRIRCFKTDNNGPSAARNFGLGKTRGQYITFCDDDDEYLPGKIKKQLKLLDNNPELAFCYTNSYIKSNLGNYIFLKNQNIDNYFPLLLKRNPILAPATVMVRSKILKKYKGFDENLDIAEDYDLWLRVAKNHKFAYLNEPLVVVYKHSGNLTGNTYKTVKFISIVKYNHLKDLHNKFPKKFEKIIKWNIHFQKAKIDMTDGNFQKAKKSFLKSIRVNPLDYRQYLFLLSCILKTHLLNIVFLNIFSKLQILKLQKSKKFMNRE